MVQPGLFSIPILLVLLFHLSTLQTPYFHFQLIGRLLKVEKRLLADDDLCLYLSPPNNSLHPFLPCAAHTIEGA